MGQALGQVMKELRQQPWTLETDYSYIISVRFRVFSAKEHESSKGGYRLYICDNQAQGEGQGKLI